MLQGIAIEPDFQRLVSTRSVFLTDLGRTHEAIAVGARALAANRLDAKTNSRYANALTEAGQFDAARAAANETFRIRPDDWTDQARLSVVMFYGSVQDAQAMLNQSAAHPYPGEGPALSAWAAFLKARETHDAGDKARAIAAIKYAAQQGPLFSWDVVPAFCALGDLDDAFAQFDSFGLSLALSHIDFLWTPAAAPLLRDPRFWAYAAKLGLTKYWRTTGHWPDVCLVPGGIDCKTMASAAGQV